MARCAFEQTGLRAFLRVAGRSDLSTRQIIAIDSGLRAARF
jgi:hypothetical protein